MNDSSEKRFREVQNRGGHIVPPVHGPSLFQGGESAAIIRLLKEGLRMITAIVARRLNLSPERGDTPGFRAVAWKHSSMELA
jgi:hypothetical protein